MEVRVLGHEREPQLLEATGPGDQTAGFGAEMAPGGRQQRRRRHRDATTGAPPERDRAADVMGGVADHGEPPEVEHRRDAEVIAQQHVAREVVAVHERAPRGRLLTRRRDDPLGGSVEVGDARPCHREVQLELEAQPGRQQISPAVGPQLFDGEQLAEARRRSPSARRGRRRRPHRPRTRRSPAGARRRRARRVAPRAAGRAASARWTMRPPPRAPPAPAGARRARRRGRGRRRGRRCGVRTRPPPPGRSSGGGAGPARRRARTPSPHHQSRGSRRGSCRSARGRLVALGPRRDGSRSLTRRQILPC